jgi:hypothetical protein
MRVALMKKDRFADERSQLQLAMERLLLNGARREVAIVVESAFTHGNHFGTGGELTQLRPQLIAELACIVRMNTRRGEQAAEVALCKSDRLVRARAVAAGYYHLDYAGLRRPCNHGVTIAIEAVVSEIDADIDQGTGYHV